jgi:hypothetical protein
MVAHTAASAAMPGPADGLMIRGPKYFTRKRKINCWTASGCRPANVQTARKKLNEFLDQHPRNVWQTLEMLQNGAISKTREAKLRAVANTHWHGTHARMRLIPKYWMQAYMLDINPELEKHLEAIKSSSNTAMRELFYASHMLTDNTLIPDAGREKVVFAKMLRARYAQCGSRLARAHLWPLLPGFKWTCLPIFTVIPGLGCDLVADIMHISGATYSIPETLVQSWVPGAGGEWMKPWSDTEAEYTAGAVTLRMRDIFDFSSLDPQLCLSKLVPGSEGQEGQEPTTPTKIVGPLGPREEASSSKKVPISTPFNPDLLPVSVRPNRRKVKVVGHRPYPEGFGNSYQEHRVKVVSDN